mmetsp:Transcript_25131/g.34632  ORF Transcript_25131/g.34632 Transcript_25131/m.34632 type:complete len:168 (+) Transcript_25131:103-606(+)|eukprot:CAMPEP_0196580246 /NCGR_PEP_ID=MMETSP1081-20130531/28059_1 /TAXON_ID=36882 /ORGANISM="Pyramimonas amylifera, Strain CCMP720" /LENGTH=167 /DNA_ID=CAMNT_0041900073 /DNA_START=93 /DNA_END=596 /DNA_ORIENTATION=+
MADQVMMAIYCSSTAPNVTIKNTGCKPAASTAPWATSENAEIALKKKVEGKSLNSFPKPEPPQAYSVITGRENPYANMEQKGRGAGHFRPESSSGEDVPFARGDAYGANVSQSAHGKTKKFGDISNKVGLVSFESSNYTTNLSEGINNRRKKSDLHSNGQQANEGRI